ncbi:hypothetical protein DX928_16995 [Bacillus swezeyi]|nr:hypothetical protein DX928_16995 [Bacillus swezeyi]
MHNLLFYGINERIADMSSKKMLKKKIHSSLIQNKQPRQTEKYDMKVKKSLNQLKILCSVVLDVEFVYEVIMVYC